VNPNAAILDVIQGVPGSIRELQVTADDSARQGYADVSS
jgi:hypothetical protein